MSSLETQTLIVAAVGFILTAIGFIPLYADWLSRRKVSFSLLRFHTVTDNDDYWGIRIVHPTKAIEKCSVTYDGRKLNFMDSKLRYEKFIGAMSGDNLVLSRGAQKDDAKVVVWDGNKIILKKKFIELPTVDE